VIAAIMGVWASALIAIAVRWPQRLVPAAIVCSVFQAAALVKVGGLAVSPYYFTLILIAARCVILRVTPADALGHGLGVRRIMWCAAVLVVLCVGSGLVMPFVFAGLPVLSPRLDADYAAPLEFSTSNIAQCVYLVLNVMMLWYAAQTCRTPEAVRGVVRAFVAAGVLVLGFAAYQLVSSFTGIPFPSDILYSNDSYAIQSGTAVLDMPRICSTYTEPAAVASFLIPFILFLSRKMESTAVDRWEIVLLVLSIVFSILSTSSTAYLGLGAIGMWSVVRYVFFPILKGRGSVKAALTVVLILGVTIVAVARNDTLKELLRTMVFEKDQSSSYEERSYADHFSADLALRTWGLGVGLGSNRGSGFLPTMLSTIGVLGTAMMGVLLVLLVRTPRGGDQMQTAHSPFAAALIGALGVSLIAGPDLSSPSMWVVMTALMSVRAAGQPSSDPAGEPASESA
jgi:hypothetical protein